MIDVNLSPDWAAFLNAAGHEAIHWTSIGESSAPDLDIMNHAAENNWVVLTRDLDFGALLASRESARPSVIQLRGKVQLPGKIGERVLRLLETSGAELGEGAFVTIDLAKTRLRFLPIRPQ